MSQPDRIRYLMDRSYGRSVITIPFGDWRNMVRVDGEPTVIEQIPDKISGVMKQAEVVVAVASGIANPSPGIDVVRLDPRDDPYIYNTDHYVVVEKLSAHPQYLSFVQRAGVQDSEELRCTLDSWTWLIGPERHPENHWCKEVPHRKCRCG